MNPHFRVIVVFVLLSFFIFSPFYIAKAESGWLIILKEYTLDIVGRVISRTLLSVLSNTVVGKLLLSGRDGGPAFIQNWRDFLGNAQYRGEDLLRATVGDATIGDSATVCPYLKSAISSIFGGNRLPGFDFSKYRVDALQFYKLRNQCTLPSNFNLGQFQNDFAGGGGWATWSKLIQPQNNFTGVYTDTLDELSRQRNFEQSIDSQEAQSGNGYTSKRTGCSGSGENRQCTILGNVVTPGMLLGESGVKTINAEFDWLVSSDELQEALVSLAGFVGNRLTNFLSSQLLSIVPGSLGPPTGEVPPRPDAVQLSQQGCVKSKEPGCAIKAKQLSCDVSAEGGSGGSGGDNSTGGSGGSAGANCTETIDQGIYDACMAEARTNCGL